MPRTGSFDNTPLLIMGLIALGVMTVGIMSRRTARARR
jgi:LPXTG-motif cell wall-anchored protein